MFRFPTSFLAWGWSIPACRDGLLGMAPSQVLLVSVTAVVGESEDSVALGAPGAVLGFARPKTHFIISDVCTLLVYLHD